MKPRSTPELKWLIPGMHVKRWLLLLFIGITLLSISLAYLLRELYLSQPYPEFVYYLALQFWPRPVRALIFALIGLVFICVSFWGLQRSFVVAFLRPGQARLVDVVYQRRQLQRGPRIVAIGGGTGLSALLRGLKEYSDNITAIVTVADDGGSSGRLRREMGLLPPGDFRNCIAALSEAEGLTQRLFQYRFSEGMGLNGHSFGNLFIAAMAGVTGSFEQGLSESSRVLAVRGRVLPSTLENVTLCADLREDNGNGEVGWRRVSGESNITGAHAVIERVFLQPDIRRGYPVAIRAILQADLIIAGPGSLYTSVLPNLLVEDVAAAVNVSSAQKLYVCNIATQRGETDNYGVAEHMRALNRHVGPLFRTVLANDNFLTSASLGEGVDWVRLPGTRRDDFLLLTADLVDNEQPWRHDPEKLARAIMNVYTSQR